MTLPPPLPRSAISPPRVLIPCDLPVNLVTVLLRSSFFLFLSPDRAPPPVLMRAKCRVLVPLFHFSNVVSESCVIFFVLVTSLPNVFLPPPESFGPRSLCAFRPRIFRIVFYFPFSPLLFLYFVFFFNPTPPAHAAICPCVSSNYWALIENSF